MMLRLEFISFEKQQPERSRYSGVLTVGNRCPVITGVPSIPAFVFALRLFRLLFPLFLLTLYLGTPSKVEAQTYYYPGGSISANDLRNARPYKKGTYLLQGRKRGIIWIPKYDARGNRYLALLMEHFLQGTKEILDYSPIQVETIIGGSHGPASVLALLMDLEVRTLLEIDKEQGEKINAIFSDFRKHIHTRMAEFQRTNPNATAVQSVLVRTSEIERQALALQTRLEMVLTPKQWQQAREMVFQLYNGFDTAVVDIGILSLFDLTREQREKLELIAEDANEKRERIFSGKNTARLQAADYQGYDQALQEVAFVTSRKIRDVMTPEQLKRGDELMLQANEFKTKLGLTND